MMRVDRKPKLCTIELFERVLDACEEAIQTVSTIPSSAGVDILLAVQDPPALR